MSPSLSIGASALVVAASLALLMLAVSRLGRTEGVLGAMFVLGIVTLKFAVLALGLGWSARQGWFSGPWAAFGAALPLAALILWKKHG